MADEVNIKLNNRTFLIIVFILLAIFLLILIPKFSGNKGNYPINENGNSESNIPEIGKKAPDVTFTTINGKKMKLSDFYGEKVMFWHIATWCPSCIKAAEVLEQNNNRLKNLKIVVLKNYGNSGYPGPSISEFAKKYAIKTLKYDNWIWGDADRKITEIYNPKNYPDIYFLIDENGILRDIDGAPSASLSKIINFAGG